MKKFIFSTVLGLLTVVGSAFAEPLLKEGFESATSMPPKGWNVIKDSQPGSVYHWELVSGTAPAPLSGTKGAYCNSGSYINPEPAKEEWLVSPSITLGNESYKVEFLWKGFILAASNKEYDFQVRVSEDNGSNWTTVFSFIDKKSVEASGITYPWANITNKSIVDISAYKGKSVKIAFIHKKLMAGAGKGNSLWLDDILVESYNPILSPVVEGETAYGFGESYIGEKKYSTPLSIKNVGIDTLRIISISGLDGTDFGTNINPSAVKLGRNGEYKYNAIYNPTLTGGREATLVIETNGGTLNVALEGTKKMLPQGYTFEGFEANFFPPLGWKKSDGWKQVNMGIGGDKCAAVSLSKLSELTTPRLDLSSGSHSISFDFIEQFEAMTEETYGPQNYFQVYSSIDGGSTWTKVFENSLSDLNKIINKTIELSGITSDNCYVKFVYSFPDLNITDPDEIPEFSDIFLDNIVLPPLYGSSSVPGATSKPNPADNAVNAFNQELELSWQGALFATGYKLYVGTSAASFETINGLDLGNKTSYSIPTLNYNTKYFWKVVPYSSVGEASNVPVWNFTVMSDQTIKTFPYSEGFESETFPSLGWRNDPSKGGKWTTTDFNPYDGKKSAYTSSISSNSENILESPQIVLPSDKTIQVSFIWGNSVPAGLSKSSNSTQVVKNDTLFYEIKGSDGKWKALSFISGSSSDNQKWTRERVVLTDYIGQTVSFRWRYASINPSISSGAALDNILIDEASLNGKAVINKEKWDAGIVNYQQSFSSKNIFTLLNDGEAAITISSIKFQGSNFTTSLPSDMTLDSREDVPFAVTFNAGTSAKAVKDTMTISFTNGLKALLPLSGIALPADIKYFGFEEDTFGSTTVKGLTTVDMDGAATCRPVLINYPNYGNPFAFIVINHKPEPEGADWRNIYPHSGDQVLAALSAQSEGVTVNDWIISEKMTATTGSNFKFFAKSYGSDFEKSKVTVWVSTTDTKISSFSAVTGAVDIELPYSSTGAFTEFNVNLSAYGGQPIYVALQHKVSYNGFVAFFDDFYFEKFQFAEKDPSAPTFETEPVTTAQVGKKYTYNFSVSDADGDNLTITTIALPSWLKFTPSANGGVVTGTPTAIGEHLFKISASDGTHTTLQEILLVVTDGNGISSVDDSSIRLFVRNSTLFIQGMDQGSVSIYSLSGEMLGTWKETHEIDLTGWNNGLYIVKIKTATGLYSGKIVKNN